MCRDVHKGLHNRSTDSAEEHAVCASSANVKRGEYPEILFWLLLLGSWQFLASTGARNGIIGTVGTAGFLLFRAFDIWKPYPARRLESLESGLGIMADDIVAGAYAAAVLSVIISIILFI